MEQDYLWEEVVDIWEAELKEGQKALVPLVPIAEIVPI
jgi:hypothetical protein